MHFVFIRNYVNLFPNFTFSIQNSNLNKLNSLRLYLVTFLNLLKYNPPVLQISDNYSKYWSKTSLPLHLGVNLQGTVPYKHIYQLPLILTAALRVAWLTLSISRHMPLSGHADVALFEWRRQWGWIDTKTIITSYSLVWRVNQLGKLKNRIPGSHLLISSLPSSASRMHVKSLGKPCDVNKPSWSLVW